MDQCHVTDVRCARYCELVYLQVQRCDKLKDRGIFTVTIIEIYFTLLASIAVIIDQQLIINDDVPGN